MWAVTCSQSIEVIGLNGFLFVEFDTSRSAICHMFRYCSFFCPFLFARYALSSRSVRSGRARSEIFRENINYLHLIIFVRDAGQDVLTCIDLITRDLFIFVWLRQRLLIVALLRESLKLVLETFCVESVMHLALI